MPTTRSMSRAYAHPPATSSTPARRRVGAQRAPSTPSYPQSRRQKVAVAISSSREGAHLLGAPCSSHVLRSSSPVISPSPSGQASTHFSPVTPVQQLSPISYPPLPSHTSEGAYLNTIRYASDQCSPTMYDSDQLHPRMISSHMDQACLAGPVHTGLLSPLQHPAMPAGTDVLPLSALFAKRQARIQRFRNRCPSLRAPAPLAHLEAYQLAASLHSGQMDYVRISPRAVGKARTTPPRTTDELLAVIQQSRRRANRSQDTCKTGVELVNDQKGMEPIPRRRT